MDGPVWENGRRERETVSGGSRGRLLWTDVADGRLACGQGSGPFSGMSAYVLTGSGECGGPMAGNLPVSADFSAGKFARPAKGRVFGEIFLLYRQRPRLNKNISGSCQPSWKLAR